MTSIGICIPTARISAMTEFMKRWGDVFAHAARDGLSISVFVHEDAPARTENLTFSTGIDVLRTCHTDLEDLLGEKHWIIPRRSGACRSFPMYLAWKKGCEYIVTLDDDCYPPLSAQNQFFSQHLNAFKLDRWFRTVSGVKPRGIPYTHCGTLPVILNHGVWSGEPDLDGPTSLTAENASTRVTLRAGREVVPPGMFFPLCAMNVCYHRSAIPAAYNLLMGQSLCGFDRFDDIWSGLFLKRLADHLGLYITNGVPFVHHAKASNPFVNNRKEALGLHLHEFFWKHIAAAPLKERELAACYAELADWVTCFPEKYPEAPSAGDYFERLGEAMRTWVRLFSSC